MDHHYLIHKILGIEQMDLLDEIEFKEQQISRLNNLLKKYKEQEIPENNKKKNPEKSKQLPLPFCG